MTKRILLFLSVILLTLSASAKPKHGYKIKLKFKHNVAGEYIHLAHYYAKPLPTIYRTDSAKIVGGNTAIFENKDSILGGIYLILFDERKQFTEILLDDGDEFEMTIDTANNQLNNTVKNSIANEQYFAYKKFLIDFGDKQQKFEEQLKTAKNKADSQKIQDARVKHFQELIKYKKDFVSQNPKSFLATVFNALETPEIPKEKKYLADGVTVDSLYPNTYYKQHYWDKFDFTDNRLIYTPIYEGRLDEYFNKVIWQLPDTLKAEADKILSITRKTPELFKYTLHWLTNTSISSKVMGMDEFFVHLVEKYHMNGDAYWLDSATIEKYKERAVKISPNIIGNKAPELLYQDVWSLQDVSLLNYQAKYTILVFWSIDCNHCLTETPKIDSVYRNVLKAKGAKIYSVPTSGDLSKIQEVIKEKGFTEWQHAVDANHTNEHRNKYDVITTPKVYLLDENKVIIGKNLDHSNLAEVIRIYEKRKELKK